MPLPQTKDAVLKELHGWENIINSADWVVYRNFLKEHCAFLQKEVNDQVRKQNMVEAFASLRAMEDANKMLTLITQRISSLNNRKEDE